MVGHSLFLRGLLGLSLTFGAWAAPAEARRSQIQTDFVSLEFPFVPDASMTQGHLCDENDPDFKNYRYGEKIPYCSRNVSSGFKARIYDDYGVPKHCRGQYTIDHFIPLSIGGSNQRANLWPEHKSIKNLRKKLEEDVFHAVSTGKMTQAQAVQMIENAKWNPPVDSAGSFDFCN